MKITRCLTIAIALLGLTGVARAITFRVLDPSGFPPGVNITQLGETVGFSFYSDGCPTEKGAVKPEGCFDAVNDTGSVITSLSATIVTNTALPLDPTTGKPDIDCPTDGFAEFGSFTDPTTCSVTPLLSGPGDAITVVFSGGAVQPYINTIWIIEQGVSPNDFDPNAGQFTVGGAVPEPASLWMALTGLAPLGYALRRRRRAAKP